MCEPSPGAKQSRVAADDGLRDAIRSRRRSRIGAGACTARIAGPAYRTLRYSPRRPCAGPLPKTCDGQYQRIRPGFWPDFGELDYLRRGTKCNTPHAADAAGTEPDQPTTDRQRTAPMTIEVKPGQTAKVTLKAK